MAEALVPWLKKIKSHFLLTFFVMGVMLLSVSTRFGQKESKPEAKSEQGQNLSQNISSGPSTAIEQEKLQLEREKHKTNLELEKQKLALEDKKAWISGASVLIPLLLGAISLAFGVWNHNKQAVLQREASNFQAAIQVQLKAAEIVLNAKGPAEVRNKARAMKSLLKEHLPDKFAEEFNPSDFSGKGPSVEGRKELLKLAVEHMDSRDDVVRLWLLLFPGDEWAAKLLKDDSLSVQKREISGAN
jgi:hypothetical protein